MDRVLLRYGLNRLSESHIKGSIYRFFSKAVDTKQDKEKNHKEARDCGFIDSYKPF